MTVLESGVAAAPPVQTKRRPAAALPRPARRESSSPAMMSSLLVLVVVAGAAVMLNPAWKKRAMDALGMDGTPAEVVQVPPKTVEETPVVPQVVEQTVPEESVPVVSEPVIPEPVVAVPNEPEMAQEAPEEKTKPSTLEAAAPDIAKALVVTDGRISAAPASTETEVRNFIRSLYVPRNGGTYASELSNGHPALMLTLLADLWKRIEDSPGAVLPASPALSITTGGRSRSQDLTETYVKLLEKESAAGKVDAARLEKISAYPEMVKLLEHFAKGQDSGTPDNALTLGRMIHDIRNGDAPLASSAVQGKIRSIDDLPKVGRSVDLGGFESVQELVKWAHGIKPSKESPVSVTEGEEAKQVGQRAKAYINLPPAALLAHPSAEEFPGKVSPKAPRIEKELTIDTAVAGWHPTGLYAAPGEVITVRVPASLRGKGYKVVIGTNADDLMGGTFDNGQRKLQRFSLVIQRTPLDESRVEVGNPFGGPIFIDAPYRGGDDILSVPAHGEVVRCYPKAPSPDLQKVTIGGAVEMPWWRPGMTAEEWRKQLSHPAPWAEMDFGMLRMSIPTESAKGIRDPAKLTEFWKLVMDAQWKFGGFPGVRVIPMRVNWDRQISAGFMHSGYPIGAPLYAINDGIDLSKIRMLGTWGLFHEIGHNHQPVCITPTGFSETTVNIFSLSAQAAILPNKDPNLGHPALADPKELLRRRRAGENEAFVNLSVFLALIKEFGMESLTKTMQVYWKETGKGGVVANLEPVEREDVWVRRFGDTVERDVCAFFDSVHYTITPATRAALSKYKAWEP